MKRSARVPHAIASLVTEAGLLSGANQLEAQSYQFAGGFSSIGGATEFLPPGVSQGSAFSGALDLTGILAGSGNSYTLPADSFVCDFSNGSYSTLIDFSDVTLAYTSGANASLQISGQNGFDSLTLNYTSISTGAPGEAGLVSLMDSGAFNVGNASFNVENPVPGFSPAQASGSLGVINQVPEPATLLLTGVGLVGIALLRRAGRGMDHSN